MKIKGADMKFYLLTGLILMAITAAAENNNPYLVPAVQIRSLKQYQGKYLTAYYAVSSVAGMALDPTQVNVSQVYVVIADRMIDGDELGLESQSIRWSGVSKPNSLVLAIHERPQFTWINRDGTLPVYLANQLTATGNTQQIGSAAVSLLALRHIARSNNGIAFYDFSAPLPSGSIVLPGQLRLQGQLLQQNRYR
jgi:hypothetical protein